MKTKITFTTIISLLLLSVSTATTQTQPVNTEVPPIGTILISPKGNITDMTPTYTWASVDSATDYYLWVSGPTGTVIQQWYTSAEANCGQSETNSACSVAPDIELDVGSYLWWIQTRSEDGDGPWSEPLRFNAGIPTGFVFEPGDTYMYVFYTLVPVNGNIAFCSDTPPEALETMMRMREEWPKMPVRFWISSGDIIVTGEIVFVLVMDEVDCSRVN